MCPKTILAVVLVLSASAAVAQGPKLKGTPVKPAREWSAVVKDNDLRKAAPKSGLITDAKAFATLWKAWRATEKVPEIDFSKQFVLVVLGGGPNRPHIRAAIDDGELRYVAMQTLIGGPGFGYTLAVFDRKGIKTVNGKALPKN